MLDAYLVFINEEFHARRVMPGQMDELWARGWRHFGTHFFRYNLAFHKHAIRCVIPLRIRLADFSFSKSQRRALRRNADLRTETRPLKITRNSERLFARHRSRFASGAPDSIYTFVMSEAGHSPCKTLQHSVYDGERLVAESYFDVGTSAVSGVYAVYEPEEANRRLGIFTMLKEIEYAIDHGSEFYYLGYTYDAPSPYDYKKRFRASESFDWNGSWAPFEDLERSGMDRAEPNGSGPLDIR